MPRNNHQRPTSPPAWPHQPEWDAREALLRLPRALTAAEQAELARLEAHLTRAGVLSVGPDF